MTSRQEVMVRLQGLRIELATRYDVREIGVFGWPGAGDMSGGKTAVPGTVARDGHDTACELGILVGFGPLADLITYVGLWQYLEDIFGMKIGLLSKGGLWGRMRDAVMRDVVFV
jgi:predicted nucleotidyltransferase